MTRQNMDLMKGKRRKNNRHQRSILSNIVILIGACICVMAITLCLIICVDRLSEFLNGSGYRNNWSPVSGHPLDVLKAIPMNLYICFSKFLEATFASILFFPLVILMVPLYDLFYFGDYSILLYGYLPFISGLAIIFTAIVAGEPKVSQARQE